MFYEEPVYLKMFQEIMQNELLKFTTKDSNEWGGLILYLLHSDIVLDFSNQTLNLP